VNENRPSANVPFQPNWSDTHPPTIPEAIRRNIEFEPYYSNTLPPLTATNGILMPSRVAELDFSAILTHTIEKIADAVVKSSNGQSDQSIEDFSTADLRKMQSS
jgi:hypothetical protein